MPYTVGPRNDEEAPGVGEIYVDLVTDDHVIYIRKRGPDRRVRTDTVLVTIHKTLPNALAAAKAIEQLLRANLDPLRMPITKAQFVPWFHMVTSDRPVEPQLTDEPLRDPAVAVLLQFFDEQCKFGNGYQVHAGAFYRAYKAWCIKSGVLTTNRDTFERVLMASAPVTKKRVCVLVYDGVALK